MTIDSEQTQDTRQAEAYLWILCHIAPHPLII